MKVRYAVAKTEDRTVYVYRAGRSQPDWRRGNRAWAATEYHWVDEVGSAVTWAKRETAERHAAWVGGYVVEVLPEAA